jgi:hypothetical protein
VKKEAEPDWGEIIAAFLRRYPGHSLDDALDLTVTQFFTLMTATGTTAGAESLAPGTYHYDSGPQGKRRTIGTRIIG